MTLHTSKDSSINTCTCTSVMCIKDIRIFSHVYMYTLECVIFMLVCIIHYVFFLSSLFSVFHLMLIPRVHYTQSG